MTRCWVEDEPVLVGRDDQRVAAVVRRTVEVSAQDGASCGLRHIQLYTPPGRPAIAVEPFSSPPNALNLLAEGHAHTDVRELGPGAEAPFTWRSCCPWSTSRQDERAAASRAC